MISNDRMRRLFPRSASRFLFKCYPVSMLPGAQREDLERGGKIILPPSALNVLTRLNVAYPMLFKLVNIKKSRFTHAGVLEFIAPEGRCYMPSWMMKNLYLALGKTIGVEVVNLPVATYSKFQPQSVDFLDISNPKAVLENTLRNFACLTKGDIISITYNRKVYDLCVLETRPAHAVAIIECDMNVEFVTPAGYGLFRDNTKINNKTIEKPKPKPYEAEDPFQGEGNRLDGKTNKSVGIKNASSIDSDDNPNRPGVPNPEYRQNLLNFCSNGTAVGAVANFSTSNGFEGTGYSLKEEDKEETNAENSAN